jgi:5'-nucleotidase
MSELPLILVCNDDGVYAPGVKHLWQAIQHMAEIVVVAPSVEQSSTSLSITVRHPLRLEKVEWPLHSADVWSVSGTPADCVKLALNVVLPRAPDLILSGINRGSNAGRNVLYSGTVAAVIEGIMHDIPGIAFSVSDYSDPNYAEIEYLIPVILEYVLKHPLPIGTFLNVNFPLRKHGSIKGIQLTNQGKEYWAENPEQRQHPIEGNSYYWLGAKTALFEEEEDSDISWLSKGYATIVPIQAVNLTHHDHLRKEKQSFENFVNLKHF